MISKNGQRRGQELRSPESEIQGSDLRTPTLGTLTGRGKKGQLSSPPARVTQQRTRAALSSGGVGLCHCLPRPRGPSERDQNTLAARLSGVSSDTVERGRLAFGICSPSHSSAPWMVQCPHTPCGAGIVRRGNTRNRGGHRPGLESQPCHFRLLCRGPLEPSFPGMSMAKDPGVAPPRDVGTETLGKGGKPRAGLSH